MIKLDLPTAKKVGDFVKFWSGQHWRMTHYYVRHCRLSKMWDKSHVRLEVTIQEHNNHEVELPTEGEVQFMCPYQLWMRIKANICSLTGVAQLDGMAPRGDLEQRIQKWLDAQEESS